MKYNYVYFNADDGVKLRKNPDAYNAICVADLEKMDGVHVVSYPLDYAPYAIRWLFAAYHTPKINRFIKLPLKKLWFPYYFRDTFCNGKPLCFIIAGGHLPVDYLKYLKQTYRDCALVKIHRDLIRLVSVQAPSYTREIINELFDLEMSYDEVDAQQYKIPYFVEIESKVDVPVSRDYPLSDVFFAGKAKDRLPRLMQIYHILTDAGLKCSYYLTDVPAEQQIPYPGITYADGFMPYKEMLYYTVNTRCVLEINQSGAVGYTSRFLEAVIYGKKLITDNMSIKKSKFYDPRYIQCFETPERLDTEFVYKDVGVVDYHYNGEFSPIHLIEQIDRELTKERGENL